MASNEDGSSARRLHTILADLWPLLEADRLGIVIDSAGFAGDATAFHTDDPLTAGQCIAAFGPGHAAGRLLGPEGPPGHLLVIDHAKIQAGGGWSKLLLVGLHEFAHAIRSELAEGIYPTFTTLKTVSEYLEDRLGGPLGSAPPAGLLVTNQLMGAIGQHLFKDGGSGRRPLFGEWGVRTNQHDCGHDLLFYLVVYMLEREATDRGHFLAGAEVTRSVYMPGRVDARL
jgi:hypothetical protein